MFGRIALSVGTAILVASVGSQRVWQADVSVRALDVATLKPGGPITARVSIAADSDVARAVRVEIILPVGVAVLRLPAGCRTSPSPVATLSARVTCALGDLPERGQRDVSIATTGSASAGRLRFAAFAFSDTPDPVPSNNFFERVLP
jgi:hypothetical protein